MKNSKTVLSVITAFAMVFSAFSSLMAVSAESEIKKQFKPMIEDNTTYTNFDNIDVTELDAQGFTSTKYSRNTTTSPFELSGETNRPASEYWFSGNDEGTPYYKDDGTKVSGVTAENVGLKPRTNNSDNDRYYLYSPYEYESFKASAQIYWGAFTGIVFGEKNTNPTKSTDSAVRVYFNNKNIQINGAVDLNSRNVTGGTTSVSGNTLVFTPNSFTKTVKTVYTLNVKVENGILTVYLSNNAAVLTVELSETYESGPIGVVQRAFGGDNGGIKSLYTCKLDSTEYPNYVDFDNVSTAELVTAGYTSTRYSKVNDVWTLDTEATDKPVGDHWSSGYKRVSANAGLKPLTNEITMRYLLNTPYSYDEFEASAEFYWNGDGNGMIFGEKNLYTAATSAQEKAIYVCFSNNRIQLNGALDFSSAKVYNRYTGDVVNTKKWTTSSAIGCFYFTDKFTHTTGGVYKLNVKMTGRMLYVWVDDYENILEISVTSGYKSESIALTQLMTERGGIKSFNITTDSNRIGFDNIDLANLEAKGFTATKFIKNEDNEFVKASDETGTVSSYWFTGKSKNSPYYKEDGSDVTDLWYTNYGIKPRAITDDDRYYLNTPYKYTSFLVSADMYIGYMSGIVIGKSDVYPNSAIDSAISLEFNGSCIQIGGAVDYSTVSVTGTNAAWDPTTKMFNYGITVNANEVHTLNVELKNRALKVWVDDGESVLTALVADNFSQEAIALLGRACNKDRGGFKALTVKELQVVTVTGDTNGDGRLDSLDLARARKSILMNETTQFDINGDGFFDIRDLVALKKLLIAAQTTQVWVDGNNGSDSNGGGSAAPFKSLTHAFETAGENGTVNIVGEYDAVLDRYFGKPGKTVTLTGGTLNLSNISELTAIGNVVFEDINIKVNGVTVYANGHNFTVDESVSFDGRVEALYGGGKGFDVKTTNLDIKAGTYVHIYAGSNAGTVLGDTHLNLGGTVNAGLDVHNHDYWRYAYGGGLNDTVKGNTNVTFRGNARINTVYGGGSGANSVVEGVCNLTVNGGSAMGFYGGSHLGSVKNTALKMNGGVVEQIFGGSYNASLVGNTDVKLISGTVSRRIYGGCYNDTGSSLSFATDYFVKGVTDVTIGDNLSYTHNLGGTEYAICAGSRNSLNHTDEKSILRFETQKSYNSVQSYIGSNLLSVSGYDEIHIA